MTTFLPTRGFTSGCGGVAACLETPVRIGLPFDHKSGETGTFLPENFLAVWDTGATNSCIVNGLAKQLNLPIIGEVDVVGPDGPYVAKVYFASIVLPNQVCIPEIELFGCNDSLGSSMLIGMDVITQGDFLVNTFNGQTTFSFRIPAVQALDLHNFQYTGPGPVKLGRNALCPCGSGKKFKQCCDPRR